MEELCEAWKWRKLEEIRFCTDFGGPCLEMRKVVTGLCFVRFTLNL